MDTNGVVPRRLDVTAAPKTRSLAFTADPNIVAAEAKNSKCFQLKECKLGYLKIFSIHSINSHVKENI
jgi:hypothetical protein